ncbi:hypothetical protein H8F06_18195 [Vibrio fluvialis]|uniref:hypothetical protein n=1 Tax=Vibrio fluvialis TaxID=676 RepID=UPI001559639A|nr:hypothetical protein [Vibrio fluvialis]EMC0408390.1 hypothetical protein [Vibrio fluvialis]MBL4297227.1 hypothetical protein [Vibrio fluvialis]WDY55244.1 hypothetical protein PUN47_17965 [Vibrio fluvialis]
MTPLEYLEKQKALIDDINSVLSRHGITESIDLSNITITEQTVSDFVKDNQKLSNLIVDAIWPSIDELTVYHYTSKEAAESILNSGEFRLYSLLKRFTEGEITTFCQNHGLDGYLGQNESGDPKYKSLLMSNMFYASFTDTNLTSDQEDYFWRTFASIDGVRLKLNVTASNPNFRKMVYEKTKGNPLPLLSELTGAIKKSYGREFVLSGISRLCAFYLAKDFDVENEYRALYRYWDGFGPSPQSDGKHQYVGLPLDGLSDTGYRIKIEEIQTDENLNIPSQYVSTPRNA